MRMKSGSSARLASIVTDTKFGSTRCNSRLGPCPLSRTRASMEFEMAHSTHSAHNGRKLAAISGIVAHVLPACYLCGHVFARVSMTEARSPAPCVTQQTRLGNFHSFSINDSQIDKINTEKHKERKYLFLTTNMRKKQKSKSFLREYVCPKVLIGLHFKSDASNIYWLIFFHGFTL